MPLTIPVAHDFICPWCWVGLLQARRLQEELGARIEWRGYELFPAELEWPDYPSPKIAPINKPSTPSRFDLMLAAEGIEMPHIERPKKMRTYHAHQAVEYAKTEGDAVADALIEALYRAYWQRGEAINELPVLKKIATGIVHDVDAMLDAARTRRFKDKIVGFDDDAYAKGVYNVPTFFIGGERLAEQPYAVLLKAAKKAQEELGGTDVYNSLEFPAAPANRPYVFINMVATIDGKILSGGRNDSVADLGSKIDHLLMKRTERAADAVVLGAQTLRATPPTWNPQAPRRIVVSRSGRIPQDHCFLLGGEAYVATSGSAMFSVPQGVKVIRAGGERVDLPLLLERLRGLGIQRLLVTGGSDLNGQLLRAGLVDELFLTVAPKIKLGDDVPTYAGGEALPRHALLNFHLVEHHAVGDEVFLRYRK
jgi:riboflavin biosynthesis pyrimidine reductase/predicted DsbA family dithiol-disulfide isomerase